MKLKISIHEVVLWAILLQGASAFGSVMPIGPFPPSTLITFTGLANGTEVNGLTVSGVSFAYTVGGSPLNGAVQIDGGPGTTNIAPPNIVSIGNATGTLTMLLPSPATMFGYGYAIEVMGATVANATTISVFSGATLLGSLSYNGVPDPIFTGGFAGIQSTSAFDRVAVTFNSAAAPAFALDNIRLANGVPEPSSWSLLFVGLLCFLTVRVLGTFASRRR
jgi:hypothetical protein